jgi:hypothetical protein
MLMCTTSSKPLASPKLAWKLYRGFSCERWHIRQEDGIEGAELVNIKW